jgi:hypothetical protein
LDDFVGEDNLVRAVDLFVDELDLLRLGFAGPAATGRPGYSPATLSHLAAQRLQTFRQPANPHLRHFVLLAIGGVEHPQIPGNADRIASPLVGYNVQAAVGRQTPSDRRP